MLIDVEHMSLKSFNDPMNIVEHSAQIRRPMCCQPCTPRLASFRNRSTLSLLNKDAIEMEPCKIRGATQPSFHPLGPEGKEIFSPSGRWRNMSLTCPRTTNGTQYRRKAKLAYHC